MHLLVFAITFFIFPALGLLAKPILLPLLGQQLYWGFLFMCFLPSTVQSSIAFTSVAKEMWQGRYVVHLSQTWWVCLSRQF